MAFEGLTQRLQQAFSKLRGKGKLGEEDVKVVMREVRMALLEADVNYKVVKDFVKKTTDRCLEPDTLKALNSQNQVVTIVNDELVELMKTYKVDDKKPKVVVSGDNFISSAEIPTFGVDPQAKPKKSFFDKIRSILKK